MTELRNPDIVVTNDDLDSPATEYNPFQTWLAEKGKGADRGGVGRGMWSSNSIVPESEEEGGETRGGELPEADNEGEDSAWIKMVI